MTKPHVTQPIGIFDSGIGGLTVARSIVKHLPSENIIYFGEVGKQVLTYLVIHH